MTLQMRRQLESGSIRTTIYRRRRPRNADLHLLLLCNRRLRAASSDLNRRQEDVFGSDLLQGRWFKFELGRRSVLHVTRISSSKSIHSGIIKTKMLLRAARNTVIALAGFADLRLGLTDQARQSELKSTFLEYSGISLASKVGAGILLDKEGYILTNAHVVSNSFKFEVPEEGMALTWHWLAGKVLANFIGGEQCDAKVLSVDVGNDVALLKIPACVIKPSNVPCDFSKHVPRMGDDFFVVGHPNGLVPFNVKYGHVSNPSRPPSDIPENILNGFPHSREHMDPAMKFLELDVMAAPGFSGGPLSTVEGLVFGVLHAEIPGTAYYGIPFAIIESALGRMFKRGPGDHVFCHLN